MCKYILKIVLKFESKHLRFSFISCRKPDKPHSNDVPMLIVTNNRPHIWHHLYLYTRKLCKLQYGNGSRIRSIWVNWIPNILHMGSHFCLRCTNYKSSRCTGFSLSRWIWGVFGMYFVTAFIGIKTYTFILSKNILRFRVRRRPFFPYKSTGIFTLLNCLEHFVSINCALICLDLAHFIFDQNCLNIQLRLSQWLIRYNECQNMFSPKYKLLIAAMCHYLWKHCFSLRFTPKYFAINLYGSFFYET